MHWCTGVSTQSDSAQALAEALGQIDALRLQAGQGVDAPDLVLIFASPDHTASAQDLLDQLLGRCPGAVVLGCTAAGVAGGGLELESGSSLCLMAASLPDVALRAVHLGRTSQLKVSTPALRWIHAFGLTPDHAPAFVVLADPFSCDAQDLARAFDQAFPDCVKLGGLASGGQAQGQHVLFVGDRIVTEGAACLALWGDIEVQPVVAQGVRAIGPALRITGVDRNVVLSLNDHPAVDAFQAVFTGLAQSQRERFRRAPVVGLSVPGSRRPPGPPARHAWLVRNLIGMDSAKRVIAVGAQPQEGDWLQFMVRDAGSAREELRDLLSPDSWDGNPAQAALFFSCMGRGQGFFGESGHDSRLIRSVLGPVPIGGLFCNGELGPVNGRTALHTYTSCVGLVRPRSWD